MNVTLEKDLRDSITGEVNFTAGAQGLYAADASNYREVPLGVVIPRNIEELVTTVAVCARHGVPIVHRGGGTSLAGQTVSAGAVVIDSSKYCHNVLSIDPVKRLAIVEPGTVLDDLRKAANQYGLTFAPDPSTHNHNTLGGMLGNNSCGSHSLEGKRTVDNVHELEILTYDGLRLTVGATSLEQLAVLDKEPGRRGDIYRGLQYIANTYADEIRARYPKIPRRVSGYSLDELLPENGFHVARALIGSESTCVTILRATLKLLPTPPCKVLLVLGFDDVTTAADAVPDILPYQPDTLEGMDEQLTQYMRAKNFHVEDLHYLPEGKGWLIMEFGGNTKAEAEARALKVQTLMRKHTHMTGSALLTQATEQQAIVKVREAGLGSTAWVPGMPDTWPGWEDSAVAPENLGRYMRDLKALYKKYNYKGAMYGHFGDGLIHTRIDFALHTTPEVTHFRQFMEDAAALVVRHGGTLSGEHGDGRARAELLPIMYGAKLIQAFEEFKRIWDPLGRMNPGKIVMPKKLDTDLRYGPQFQPQQYDTVFHYPESENSFARAVMRCVGIGECRKHSTGDMCPSFRGTRDEKNSTRGRSRLLQEMLEGSVIADQWKSEAVRDALDLCLSCKACKSECPVNVDMATYRAEFLHHHYQGKLRPLTSYTMGLVHRWAPLAQKLYGLFNFLTQTPGIRAISKTLAGVHQERTLPRLTPKTFRAQWGQPTSSGKIRVVLWVDTFNNYFTPAPLQAAAEVLVHSGYEVILPEKGLCCGRPYYDFGRLHKAKQFLSRCIEVLAPLMDERTYLVGIEASCLSVFRDELGSLFPTDERAKLIAKRTLTLGALLKKHGHPEIKLDKDIIVHGHCHHKSVFGLQDEIDVLKTSGRKVELLDGGCCGMAGAFGYEKHKYPVSKAIAQQGFIPALANNPTQCLVADGFSCRHQLAHFTERKSLTLPEILRQAIK